MIFKGIMQVLSIFCLVLCLVNRAECDDRVVVVQSSTSIVSGYSEWGSYNAGIGLDEEILDVLKNSLGSGTINRVYFVVPARTSVSKYLLIELQYRYSAEEQGSWHSRLLIRSEGVNMEWNNAEVYVVTKNFPWSLLHDTDEQSMLEVIKNHCMKMD